MEEKSQLQKQKELLTKIVNEGHVIPELNVLTLNIKEVYLKEKYSDADADRMVAQFNENEQYCNLINFLYDKEIRNTPIPIRNNNIEHNGTRSTMKTTKYGDIEVYFLEGFDYNALTPDQKADLEEYLCFLDSIWEMRDEIYEKEELLKNKLELPFIGRSYIPKEIREKIKVQNKILLNKVFEDRTKTWQNLSTKKGDMVDFDSIYRIDNILRHGIVNKLGWMKKGEYDNIETLFKIRKEQLNETIDCLQKNNANHASDPISNDIKLRDYIDYLCQERDKITEKNTDTKTYVINKCNEIKWSLTKYSEKLDASEKCMIKDYTPKRIDLIDKINSISDDKIDTNTKNKIISQDIKILYEFIDDTNKYSTDEIPYEERQFIYGFEGNLEFYKNFNNYFNIMPFDDHMFDNDCYRNLVQYSKLLNKMQAFCSVNIKKLFPMRFILNRPFVLENGVKKLNINNKFLQKIQVSNKPNIFENKQIIGYVQIRGSPINFIILKYNTKTIFHSPKGQYSYYLTTNTRLERMDINNITPKQNVTWDEFNIIYNYLKKPTYIYNPTQERDINNLLIKKDDINTTFTLFIHNDECGEIPIHLLDKLTLITKDNYYKLNMNIRYKDYVQNQLKKEDVIRLFSGLRGGDYYDKYIKYKQKYFDLKNQISFVQSKGSSKNILI